MGGALSDSVISGIRSAGGRGCLIPVSVTDGGAVRAAVSEVVGSWGQLDAVVNAAGFDRPSDYRNGTAADWAAVLGVHINGHLNLLAHAVPALANSGDGHFTGFTSGAGWRAGHASAYSCAKRAICALAWSLAGSLPDAVAFNVISPVADTRMTRAYASDPAPGIDPARFPPAGHIAPLAVHLSRPGRAASNGQVLFTDGSQVARVSPPQLIEAVSVDGSGSSIGSIVTGFLAPAQAAQRTGGGAAPRHPGAVTRPAAPLRGDDRCGVVIDHGRTAFPADRVGPVLAELGLRAVFIEGALDDVPPAEVFATATARVRAAEAGDPLTRLLVLTASPVPGGNGSWQQALGSFGTLADRILHQVAWTRAVAGRAGSEPGARVAYALPGTEPADAALAQAVTQLARGLNRRKDASCLSAFSVAVRGHEEAWRNAVQLAAFLLTDGAAVDVAGAELVAGDEWLGVSAHPQAGLAASYGGPRIPSWLDEALACDDAAGKARVALGGPVAPDPAVRGRDQAAPDELAYVGGRFRHGADA